MSFQVTVLVRMHCICMVTNVTKIYQRPNSTHESDSHLCFLLYLIITYWSYAKRKDLCDEHSETSGNSYLADQVADLRPIDLPFHRFLLWELRYIIELTVHLQITLHCTCRSTPLEIWHWTDSYSESWDI